MREITVVFEVDTDESLDFIRKTLEQETNCCSCGIVLKDIKETPKTE